MKKVIFIFFSIILFCFIKNWAEEANKIPLTNLYETDLLQSNNDKNSVITQNVSDFTNIDNVTDISEEELFGDQYNFYYNLLESSLSKKLYRKFYQSVKNYDTSFSIVTNEKLPEEASSVFIYALYDNPSFFNVDYDSISIEQTVYNSALGSKSVCRVKWNYLYLEDDVQKLHSSYENMINTYLKKDYHNDYELAIEVFRFLSDMITYGGKTEDGQTIVSAFSVKQAVCGGYTMASKYVFDYLGIPCIYVSGTAVNQNPYGNTDISLQSFDNHAWNKIMLNGKWYNFDCTWGDADIEDFKYYNYKYLMVSDDILKKTHTPSQEYTDKYPKCSDTVDFYSLNNLYINLYEDPNIFLNEFINVLNFYRSDVIQFRVENVLLFEDFLKNGQLYYYFPYIEGFKYENYSYIIDVDSNVVTIFFRN